MVAVAKSAPVGKAGDPVVARMETVKFGMVPVQPEQNRSRSILITGPVTRIDLDLFCSGCTGTIPNLTVSIRATTGSPALPTGADLATATIAGFSSGGGGYFSANFGSPATLTAG